MRVGIVFAGSIPRTEVDRENRRETLGSHYGPWPRGVEASLWDGYWAASLSLILQSKFERPNRPASEGIEKGNAIDFEMEFWAEIESQILPWPEYRYTGPW
jgi:hypothetical protein